MMRNRHNLNAIVEYDVHDVVRESAHGQAPDGSVRARSDRTPY